MSNDVASPRHRDRRRSLAVGASLAVSTAAVVLATATLPNATAQDLRPDDPRAGRDAEAPAPRFVELDRLVACVESDVSLRDAELAALVEPGVAARTRVLFSWRRPGADRFTNVVLIDDSADAAPDARAARTALAPLGRVTWVERDRALLDDPREGGVDDPLLVDQYHHALMRTAEAWEITFGASDVVVAFTDDGFDVDHEDIAPNTWVNVDEIAGNGIDDDDNGFVDDVNGYDVLNDEPDPRPNVVDDDHGTHCAGIGAARTNNATGVAGTAGGATIMPVQFYSSDQGWPASVVAAGLAYAVDNGARIVSTSYNIDFWVGNETVTAAFDYLHDAGVLHFNSAGNGSALDPPRQAFEQSILVASTTSEDRKSGFSNYGRGVDVAAPGSSILSTVLADAYDTKSGTSMAAPNAAGVAALVWSANPTWTRDQVAAQVVATADSLDASDPSYAGLLGGGRVNALRALTEQPTHRRVDHVAGFPSGAVLTNDLARFRVEFDGVLDGASVAAPEAIEFVRAGDDGVFDTADDVAIPFSRNPWRVGTNALVVTPDEPLSAPGAHRLRITGLLDPFGVAVDLDDDGAPGGTFEASFVVCPSEVLSVDDLESPTGWSVESEAIDDGAWDPVPSVPVGGGDRNDPPTDFDGSGRCFLTANEDGNSDVDGGPTRLISPDIDVSGVEEPYLSYARWFRSDDDDVMTVEISDDGGAGWTVVEEIPTRPGWEVHVFRVADFANPAKPVRLRFTVADQPNDSVVEAAIDTLRVLRFDCGGVTDPRDLDGNGIVDGADLAILLAAWGGGGPADLDGDGTVDGSDLAVLLAGFGG